MVKPLDHYRQCMCSECRPPTPPQRRSIDLTGYDDYLHRHHFQPIADLLNDTREELRNLRKELKLDPGPDVKLSVKTLPDAKEE
jgi:hypothetical protein